MNWQHYVEHDAGLLTAVEPARLCGNPQKAKRVLGWTPIVGFRDLVAEMVNADMRLAKKEKLLKDHGHAAI